MQPIEFAYRSLGNAVVAQAAIDYRNALNGISYDRRFSPEEAIRRLERFFRSDYYELLTKVDCEYLMEALRKEHAENERRKDERNTCTSNT